MSQTRARAAIGTIVFFFVAPGGTAGLVPWLITRWDGDAPGWAQVVGAVTVAAGTLLVVAAFAQFVLEGRGTPAPVAPTEELVVGGLYRWVRNPMYLGVSTSIAGQAVLFASVGVGLWLVAFVLATTAFTLAYEEPTLRRTYGASYDAYAAAVPRWRPRLTPWRNG
ncbi:isoprenylcysteine carboxylmethyltransferase family protein [Nocardioides immobilis]|uniref:Isoprenylcysteine carboxylmethyltransferase family protein n=1 Tax=Nocardioides immobilis TaxID=2049295 RepID=A0A417XVH4_9ACTN|nr:isoprenylcysteine carboxylmethyltransferase family protein [Nocardioides immobilis]RHW24504.1 isoprenylcysteine carboxylmethyltransferase family protein [Nocardioides immobilis]